MRTPIAFALLLFACSGAAPPPPDAAVAGCTAALSSYCSDPGAGSVAMCGAPLTERLSLIGDGLSCTESPHFPEYGPSTGSCGAFTYVIYSPHGVDRITEFFDGGGALVAAHYESDTSDRCNGTSSDIAYGPVPDCQLHAADGGVLHCGTPDLGTHD